MDELQIAQELNRRHFLARSGLGLGAMALGSLLGARRPGAPTRPADRLRARRAACPACRTSPPKAKRVIYLFQSGAPVADRPVRPQAGASRQARDRAARLGPHGPAHHDHDLRPEEPAGGAVDLQVRPPRPVRRLAERAAAAHGASRRRPLHHPLDADRGDQPRPGDHVRPDRLAARRPAEHGGLGGLRPGQR